MSKDEGTYFEVGLAEWTNSVLANLASRIKRGGFNSLDDPYYREARRKIDIQENRTLKPQHANEIDNWDGNLSPRERNRIDKLRISWIRAGGERESYQQFYDKLIVEAQKKAGVDDVETESDSNRQVEDSDMVDTEPIMSDNYSSGT